MIDTLHDVTLPKRRSMPQAVSLALVLIPLLAATVGVCVWSWDQLGDTDIGVHGMIALVFGVVVAMAVGVGLMGLVLYSSRHGYDDTAGRDQL